MPYFKDKEELLAIQRAFFEKVASDPEVGPKLRGSGLVIRFITDHPEGEVTIDCRGSEAEGKHITTIFGACDLRPDITLTTSADLSHEFWLGRTNIVNALFTGKAKAQGDVTVAMKFLPALKPIAILYRHVLVSLGRQDLVLK